MHIAAFLLSLTLCHAPEPAVVPAVDIRQQQDTLSRSKVSAERSRRLSSSAPLQSVDAAGIERMGAEGLSEVLRTFAGVSVKDFGGIGGLKTVSVRHLGAQHTAVIYDGAAISDAQNGQVDISGFNLENVQALSVELGPSDDIFRSARSLSSYGVLTIESKRPVFDGKSTNATAQIRAASFGTYVPYIALQQKITDSFSAAANVRWLSSDGTYPFTLKNGALITDERRLNSDVSSLSAEGNIYGKLSKGFLRAKLSMMDSERGLPGSVVLYTQDPTERLWDKVARANVSYDSTPSDEWRYKIALGYDRSWNRYENTSALYQVPEDDRYLQREGSISAIVERVAGESFSLALAEDLFVNGLDARWRIVDGVANESLNVRRYSSMTAFSAQYQVDKLTMTARLLGTFMTEDSDSGNTAPDRSRLSPSLCLSWHLNDDLMFRLSASDAFRVPSFNDLYYARIGNSALVPEKVHQANLGVTYSHSFGKMAFSSTVDAYAGDVRDKIVAVPTLFIWKMRNVGHVLMAGVDATASVAGDLTSWMTMRFNANYSYQRASDVTDPDAKNYGDQIQYTPRHSGNALLSIETPWINGSYSISAVGKRYFLPQNIAANEIPGYADHSVCVYRSFRMKNVTMKLSAEALNLSDNNYELVRYYPMPGRNYRITLKIIY